MPGSVAAPRTKTEPWCTYGAGANCTHRTTLSRRVVRGARGFGDCHV